ncbi:high-affinity nickel permease [Desulfofundulus luciae]|uniref:High-affinity nickel permease n=1 Tax=Desulfofundulus luciae TaxID=74702 RepID=A0ABU0B304_9FIRM|nr:high-affinity nickel permease [Desulfofundulus luciae]
MFSYSTCSEKDPALGYELFVAAVFACGHSEIVILLTAGGQRAGYNGGQAAIFKEKVAALTNYTGYVSLQVSNHLI